MALLQTRGSVALRSFGFGFGSTADFDLINTQVLSSNTASITFSLSTAQQASYKHLQLRMAVRTTTAANSEDVWVRFNSDSTNTNYYYHGLFATGSVTGGESSQTATGARIIQAEGANDTTNAFAVSITDVFDAFSTTKNKSLRSLNGLAATQTRVFLTSNSWFSTSAISTLTIVGGSGGSFVIGSRFSLYGVKA